MMAATRRLLKVEAYENDHLRGTGKLLSTLENLVTRQGPCYVLGIFLIAGGIVDLRTISTGHVWLLPCIANGNPLFFLEYIANKVRELGNSGMIENEYGGATSFRLGGLSELFLKRDDPSL